MTWLFFLEVSKKKKHKINIIRPEVFCLAVAPVHCAHLSVPSSDNNNTEKFREKSQYGDVSFHWTTEAMKYNDPHPAYRSFADSSSEI
jgi:hypothetical protein